MDQHKRPVAVDRSLKDERKLLKDLNNLRKEWMNTLKENVSVLIDAAYGADPGKKTVEELLNKELRGCISSTVLEIKTILDKYDKGKLGLEEAEKEIGKTYHRMMSRIYGIFASLNIITTTDADELRRHLQKPWVSLQYPLLGTVIFGGTGTVASVTGKTAKKAAEAAVKKAAAKEAGKKGLRLLVTQAKILSFCARAVAVAGWILAGATAIYGDVRLGMKVHDVKQRANLMDEVMREFDEDWERVFGTPFEKEIVPKKVR